MNKLIKDGLYGLINGCVITEISFEACVFRAKIPPIEVERKLFRLGGIKLYSRDEIDLNNVKYDLHSVELQYYGKDYEIDFVVEVRKGIFYVMSVDYKFLETFDG